MKDQFEKVEFDVAGMGKTAWKLLTDFLPNDKLENLKKEFAKNPRIRISVGLHDGKLFDYRGIV